MLTAGQGDYCSCEAIPPSLQPNDPRRAILEQHGGWVAIDWLPGEEPNAASDLPPVAARLSAALAELHPQALYLSAPRLDRIELMDGPVKQRLARGAYLLPAVGSGSAAQPVFNPHDSLMLFGGGHERDLESRSGRRRRCGAWPTERASPIRRGTAWFASNCSAGTPGKING